MPLCVDAVTLDAAQLISSAVTDGWWRLMIDLLLIAQEIDCF